ncbi:MAG: hypothetical protein ACI4N3_02345 [Alphaproteobacteria bacterium]
MAIKETYSVRFDSGLPYSYYPYHDLDFSGMVLYVHKDFTSYEEAFNYVKDRFKKDKMNAPHFFIDKFTVNEDGTHSSEFGKAQYIGEMVSEEKLKSFYNTEKNMGEDFVVLDPIRRHEEFKRHPWFNPSIKGYVFAGTWSTKVYPVYEGDVVWNSRFKKIFPIENEFDKAEKKLRKKSKEEMYLKRLNKYLDKDGKKVLKEFLDKKGEME